MIMDALVAVCPLGIGQGWPASIHRPELALAGSRAAWRLGLSGIVQALPLTQGLLDLRVGDHIGLVCRPQPAHHVTEPVSGW